MGQHTFTSADFLVVSIMTSKSQNEFHFNFQKTMSQAEFDSWLQGVRKSAVGFTLEGNLEKEDTGACVMIIR